MRSLRSRLPELEALERLIADFDACRVETLVEVEHGSEKLPVHALTLGSPDPLLPALAFIGGVHGLERIGTQVLLSYLRTLKAALSWDETLQSTLSRMRLLFVPLVNPVGMALGLRSNGNGVDLMRNAPVEADRESRWFELHRGQRITGFLPWYRGPSGAPMQREALALCQRVESFLAGSRFCLCVDVHSGFLPGDRLWFPYARSREPFPHAAEVMALTHLLAQTHENHMYTVEPQAINYTTHGDLWDYVHGRHLARQDESVLLPLTLEISAQRWYRKNPGQLLTRVGLFHPVKAHRIVRAQRRHKLLFDFLMRATLSHRSWSPGEPAHRATLLREAEERWFRA